MAAQVFVHLLRNGYILRLNTVKEIGRIPDIGAVVKAQITSRGKGLAEIRLFTNNQHNQPLETVFLIQFMREILVQGALDFIPALCGGDLDADLSLYIRQIDGREIHMQRVQIGQRDAWIFLFQYDIQQTGIKRLRIVVDIGHAQLVLRLGVVGQRAQLPADIVHQVAFSKHTDPPLFFDILPVISTKVHFQKRWAAVGEYFIS